MNQVGCFGQCKLCRVHFEASAPIDWVGQKCSECGGDVALEIRTEAKIPATHIDRILFAITGDSCYRMHTKADRAFVYRRLMRVAKEQEKSGRITADEATLVHSKTEEYWGEDGIRAREYAALTPAQRRARAA
jgi:hypothetical protein